MLPRRFWATITLFTCVLFSAQTRAQIIYDITSEQKVYAEAFIELLRQWEDGEVIFYKNIANDQNLASQLDLFLVRQRTDSLDQLIPLSFIQENWERAPDELVSELPLSAGGYAILLAGILDAADDLAAQGVAPTSDGLREALYFSTFITLAAAQTEAQQAGDTEITATSIRRGGIYFFSLGWPFCCATAN